MVGPVLHQEMLLAGRRNRLHILRWIYAGWLTIQVFYLAVDQSWQTILGSGTGNHTAQVASRFLSLFVVQQLILLALVTPAFTAGAITDEKTRGTMIYLLTTDLSAWHVVVGKLLGRVAQVGMLALTGLPLLCFLGVFGGLSPVSLAALVGITVVPVFAIGAASLLAAAWTRQTRDAVIGLYFISVLVYVALHLAGSWGSWLDPLHVLEPAWGSSARDAAAETGRRLFLFSLGWVGGGAACLALAVWRLRPAYRRQLEGEGSKRRLDGWLGRRQPVSQSPIFWKERQIEGIAPLAALRRVPTWLGVLLVFLTSASSSAFLVWSERRPGVTWNELVETALSGNAAGLLNCFESAGDGFLLQAAGVALLASLVVGIRCSGAVSGERERQTWEALLLTPLSAKQLVRGKLWGIVLSALPYLAAYALPAFLFSLLGGIAAVWWTMLGLGVTALAMYFLGAAGLRCSVQAKNSWRSLLTTLAIGYVGGFLAFLATSPIVLMVAGILSVLLYLLYDLLGNLVPAVGGRRTGPTAAGFRDAFTIASCIALIVLFWGLAKFFLRDAQKWITERERTRHWLEKPHAYRTRRRRTRMVGSDRADR